MSIFLRFTKKLNSEKKEKRLFQEIHSDQRHYVEYSRHENEILYNFPITICRVIIKCCRTLNNIQYMYTVPGQSPATPLL